MANRLRDWKDELISIVQDELEMDLNEVTDMDESVMTSYWREGYTPREFFKEYILSAVDSPTDDFNPLYDL